MEIKGKQNIAKIFIDQIDGTNVNFSSINQIRALCDMEILKDSKIRIMPDVCPGIGTTIGSTFTYSDKIIPSLVSGDIGCGVTTMKLKNKNIELSKVDKIIKEQLIERKKIDNILEKYQSQINLNELYCKKYVDVERCQTKLIDLGGGNHFLEIDKDSKGQLYITIHSGSRLLGQQIYDYYLNKGYKELNDKTCNKLYTYLENDLMIEYLHDMEIAVRFASLDRESIIYTIAKFLKNKPISKIESVHNYVDTQNKIIRKGAISAQKNEELVIPISASPIYGGVIIGKGLGNIDWNFSAPHGAGRICSRAESKNMFSLSQFKENMQNVHSMNISKENIDESPMVYKRKEYIRENIKDSVQIDDILIPIYNYKKEEK